MASKQEKGISADYQEYAKALSDLRKEIRIEPYVKVSIGFYKGGKQTAREDNFVLLYEYDIPREMYFAKYWIIRWRTARFQCQYPRENVEHYLCFYEKKSGFDEHKKELLQKITNHFIQIKRQEKALQEHYEYRKTILFVTPKEEAIAQSIEQKIAWRKTELEKLKREFNEYD